MKNAIDEIMPAERCEAPPPEGVKIPVQSSSGPQFSFFELPAAQKLPELKRVRHFNPHYSTSQNMGLSVHVISPQCTSWMQAGFAI